MLWWNLLIKTLSEKILHKRYSLVVASPVSALPASASSKSVTLTPSCVVSSIAVARSKELRSKEALSSQIRSWEKFKNIKSMQNENNQYSLPNF